MHRLTRRLGDISARRPKRVLAAWLAALVVVLGLAATFGGEFTDDFVAPGGSSDRAQQLLEERFPEAGNGSALAVFAAPEGERLDGYRDAVRAALDDVDQVERVVAVGDPFTGGTVSDDGRVGYATVLFDVPATQVGPEPTLAVTAAVATARDAGLSAELGGDVAFLGTDTEASGAEVIGVAAALVILVVAFGAAVAAVVPIVLALIAVGTGLGAVALAASAFDVSTAAPTIGAMIGLGVGIDYSLLVVVRYRENRRAGLDNRRALSDAMATVGSSIAFAGGTVVLAMLALVLTGVGFLTSIGVAVALVVVVAVSAALTLLPALLTLLGDRVDRGHLRLPGRRHRVEPALEETRWWRFSHRVARRPWAWLAAGTVLLLALAAPALSMQTGFPDAGDEATSRTERRAYDLLADAFGPGINGPLVLVADLAAEPVDVDAVRERVAGLPGVASVGEPQTSPRGDTVVVQVVPTTAATDEATTQTLQRVREALPAGVAVTGLTAMTDDLTAQLADKLPVFIGSILAAAFVLMVVVFRSVLVPLKAVVLNLLSIGAAYGVVVALFQWGWGQSLLGLDATYSIVSPMPTIFFAILFGLSVDYEVFLISRIREEYDASGDPTESVARGVAATGRVITSAALIMTAVFSAFIVAPSPLLMMIGIGLATAVVVDATVVRMVLVPASMALLGRANWWLPGWVERRLPRVAAHGSVVPQQRTRERESSLV